MNKHVCLFYVPGTIKDCSDMTVGKMKNGISTSYSSTRTFWTLRRTLCRSSRMVLNSSHSNSFEEQIFSKLESCTPSHARGYRACLLWRFRLPHYTTEGGHRLVTKIYSPLTQKWRSDIFDKFQVLCTAVNVLLFSYVRFQGFTALDEYCKKIFITYSPEDFVTRVQLVFVLRLLQNKEVLLTVCAISEVGWI